jgi:hypothetical protein
MQLEKEVWCSPEDGAILTSIGIRDSRSLATRTAIVNQTAKLSVMRMIMIIIY